MKTLRYASLVSVLVSVLATTPAAFAQNAPARTCQGTFDGYIASMSAGPRCLTAPEADQLERLCRPGSLHVSRDYEAFVRATPSCQAIDLNVLISRPAPTPICEMGATEVTRGGVTTGCTCPSGTMLVHAGRHYGCAMGEGYTLDLILQTLANGASDEQCAHAGVTLAECAELRHTANNVNPANVGAFNERFTAIENRLTNVEGRVQVLGVQQGETRRDLRNLTERVVVLEQGQAHNATRADEAHATAERTNTTVQTMLGRRIQHGIGGGFLALATDGSAHPYAIGTFAYQMRAPFTPAREGFFVLDAQAGMGGAERFGFVFGGSLAATFEHAPAPWFSYGAGPVVTAMGITWSDPRFPNGFNAAWAVGLRMPVRFQPTPHVIVSLYGDVTFGSATTVVDVNVPAHGNTPASTREAGTRTGTVASGGGGITVQYLF